jgi:hypothetical protein
MLVINFGLLSKREQDRTGHRDPSDVALLNKTLWPEDRPVSRAILPAEEENEQVVQIAEARGSQVPEGVVLLTEDKMRPDGTVTKKVLKAA